MISYGVDRPPREALSHDAARVLPLAARQFFRLWMLDSGASYDVIRRRELTAGESSSERDATIVSPLKTAAGQLCANRVVTAYVSALNERITPYVLEDAPNLLSLGHRCRWEGYRFLWEPFSDSPTIETSEGHAIECVNIRNVPYLLET